MAPPEHAVAVVDAIFVPPAGAGRQVELAGQSARVAVIRQRASHKLFGRPNALPIRAQPGRMRVPSGQEAGSRRRANRILAVGMSKRDRFIHELPEIGRPNVVIIQTLNRVKALLIGADPEYIWHASAICLASRFGPAMRILLRIGSTLRTGGQSRSTGQQG
jgi:hypothetical protein